MTKADDRLMKLETQLTSHIESNDKDFCDLKATTTEIKSSVLRIEDKLAVTAKKDDLDKVLAITTAKADRHEVDKKVDKEDVKNIDLKVEKMNDLLIRGIGIGILLSMVSIAVSVFINH